MRERLDFMTDGYAAQLRDKIERGCSAYTHLNPYDFTVFKQKAYLLYGVEVLGNDDYLIEIQPSHPQGFGNSFHTHVYADSSILKGYPKFSSPYPDEILLYESLPSENPQYPAQQDMVILITEEGELLDFNN